MLDIRVPGRWQAVANKQGIGISNEALRLGRDGAKGQGGLPGTGDAGEHRQLVLGYLN